MWYASNKLGLLSTNHDYNTIDHFSLTTNKSLRPALHLCSAPVALAASSDGEYIVATSLEPPVVYVSRSFGAQQSCIEFQPRISQTVVVKVAFHPLKYDVFVLCFLDGSMSAFRVRQSATKAGEDYDGGWSLSEIGSHARVLRATSSGKNGTSQTFTGAAFLSQHRCRIVVIGGDGRCRLVELARGSTVLRTWRTETRPVALSVSRYAVGSKDATIIAIGSENCSIALYSSVGVRLLHYNLPGNATCMLSLAWIPDDRLVRQYELVEPDQTTPQHESVAHHSCDDRTMPAASPTLPCVNMRSIRRHMKIVQNHKIHRFRGLDRPCVLGAVKDTGHSPEWRHPSAVIEPLRCRGHTTNTDDDVHSTARLEDTYHPTEERQATRSNTREAVPYKYGRQHKRDQDWIEQWLVQVASSHGTSADNYISTIPSSGEERPEVSKPIVPSDVLPKTHTMRPLREPAASTVWSEGSRQGEDMPYDQTQLSHRGLRSLSRRRDNLTKDKKQSLLAPKLPRDRRTIRRGAGKQIRLRKDPWTRLMCTKLERPVP